MRKKPLDNGPNTGAADAVIGKARDGGRAARGSGTPRGFADTRDAN